MYGGVGGRTNAALVLAIVGLFSGSVVSTLPASAADLGGDCCADLEERVAELEATTATKGNRKVSLEVYGQVNQGLLFWDDGGETNVGVYTNDNARTRIGFRGKAKIDKDWEAGYRIEVGIRTANSKRFTQDDAQGDDDPNNVGFDIRDSHWYVKSKTYGAGSVGRQATATDAITEINLTQTADFSKYSDVEDTGLGLLLRSSVTDGLTGSGISWRRLIGDGGDQPGEGERRFNGVKYVSPEFSGFSVSAFWGNDDFWDVALRYAGEHAGFKISAGIGYGEITDNGQTQTVCSATSATSDSNCSQFGGSASVLHEKTGLFVNFGAGEKWDDNVDLSARFAGQGADDTQTFYAVQAGIEKKFFDLGKTTVYGEYYDYEGGANTRRTVGNGDALNPTGNIGDSWAVWGSGVQVFGLGVAQGIEKAATVLYLSYRHVEGDLALRDINGGVANGAIEDASLDDLDLVLTGAIIKF